MTHEEEQMHIVCAARGGRLIQPSVKRAIELACEHRARLTFLYILDVDFLKSTTVGHTEMVFEELDKLGEFMMIRLCEYANGRGCVTADYAIRHGELRDEIHAYLLQVRPTLLVLGRPQEDVDEGAPSAFESDAIVQFAKAVTENTGVKVELA
jgi:hypothetical protein